MSKREAILAPLGATWEIQSVARRRSSCRNDREPEQRTLEPHLFTVRKPRARLLGGLVFDRIFGVCTAQFGSGSRSFEQDAAFEVGIA